MSTNTYSSSDQAKHYLINEPISLLDFGVYKLKNKFFGFKIDHNLEEIEIPLTVNYYMDGSEIVIDGVFKEDAIILMYKRSEMVKKWKKEPLHLAEAFDKSFITDLKNIKVACNGIIEEIRFKLSVYYSTKNEKFNTETAFKLLTLMFSHVGQNYTNVPFKVGKTVADMITINLTYFYSDRKNSIYRSFKCESKLVEKDLKFYEDK